jgi:SAM-dependent methyltransferase
VNAVTLQDNSTWELMWAPYDQKTYQSVLDYIQADDTVLEIGAGDLRLAFQIAKIAQHVTAIEIHPEILERALSDHSGNLPSNLTILPGDACRIPFPEDISAGVLLMRHCTHYGLYASKLKLIGCKLLITNARWHLGVEAVDLHAARQPFKDIKIGWYACRCGAVGFITGAAEDYTIEMDQIVNEVFACPHCV